MRKKLERIVIWSAGAVVLAPLLALAVAYVLSDNDCESYAHAQGDLMKAIVYCDYGLADVLALKDIPKPAPGAHEVLVRVKAASINPIDWHFMRGTPYLMRVQSGLRMPKVTRFGVDFAGTVEAVGPGVTRFKPGDDVFGGRRGALAEYLCAREDGALARKPGGVTFEQAAAIPIAGVTALQGLRDKGKVQSGQRVLINGASGGVGTFAVQLARSFGADVTGVCSTRNAEMVRSLGASRVVDYTREDFTQTAERYDLILDNVGNRTLSEYRGVLTPKGTYVLIGGGGPNDGRWIGPMATPIKELLISPFVGQRLVMLLADLNAEDLQMLADMIDAGKLAAVIDRRYPLSEAPAAIRYLEEGHARGKVIVTVE